MDESKKLAIEIVGELEPQGRVTKENLLAKVAELGGISVEDLTDYHKREPARSLRNAAYYLAYNSLGLSLSETASLLNRKNHTTVMNGIGVMATNIYEFTRRSF
ncbi:MAG: helix-turn-helix domain-containing protein [Nanoarchaeota archaeon]